MGNKRYQTTVLTRPQNGLGRPCLTLQNAKSYFAFCTKPVSWEQVWFLSLKRNSWQKLTHKPWTKGKHEVQNHLKLVNRLGSAPAPPCDATKELVVDHGWMEPSIHPKTCCFFFVYLHPPSFLPDTADTVSSVFGLGAHGTDDPLIRAAVNIQGKAVSPAHDPFRWIVGAGTPCSLLRGATMTVIVVIERVSTIRTPVPTVLAAVTSGTE